MCVIVTEQDCRQLHDKLVELMGWGNARTLMELLHYDDRRVGPSGRWWLEPTAVPAR